jgi:hypothetical protein
VKFGITNENKRILTKKKGIISVMFWQFLPKENLGYHT